MTSNNSLTPGSSGVAYIGYSGTGSFTQQAGTIGNSTFSLDMGGLHGNGQYTMTGGTINAAHEYVGNNGTATFTQNGGYNGSGNHPQLTLGNSSTGSGTYNLQSGTLSTPVPKP